MVPGSRTAPVDGDAAKGTGRAGALSATAPGRPAWDRAAATAAARLSGTPSVAEPPRGALHPTGVLSLAPPTAEGTFSRLGFAFLLVFVFVSTSRVLDFGLNSLHIPLICSILAAVFTLISGALQIAFSSRIGKLMGLFAAWLVICIPFSEWKGGSFEVLAGTFFKSFLVFVMVAGATVTLSRVRQLIVTVALAAFIAMIVANVVQARVDGRLTMPAGFLANPNDLAQMMLVGACFMPVWAAGKGPVMRVLVVLLMLPFVYTVFDTGSRAALLALIALAILVFLYAEPMRKVLVLLLFLIAGLALFSASQTARMRLGTLFSNKGGIESTPSEHIAIASRDNRMRALEQSLELTFKNPLFGVGPGVFATSAADLSHSEGQRASWVETHNSYTQVSSEMGIPGLLFFGGAVIACLLGLNNVRKQAKLRPDKLVVQQTANAMLAGFWTFAFVSLFVSVAYQFYFSLMIGMAAAGIRVMNRELAALAGAPGNAARTPAMRQAFSQGAVNYASVLPSSSAPTQPPTHAPTQPPTPPRRRFRLRG